MSRAIAAHHGPYGRAALLELDHPLAMHAHREGHLIFHIGGPAASVSVADRTFELSCANAAAISPLQPHAFHLGDSGEAVSTLTLYIDQAWFRDSGNETSLRFGRSEIERDATVGEAMRSLEAHLRNGEPRVGLDERLLALTLACFRLSWGSRPAMYQDEQPLAQDNRIRKSIRLMYERVGEGLNIDDIASDAGLSRPHFYRLFREHVGVTPNVYLNTLRAETAIERLVTTDQPVTSIGLDLGFASQASFTRFFRANVGIPPSNYRRVVMCS